MLNQSQYTETDEWFWRNYSFKCRQLLRSMPLQMQCSLLQCSGQRLGGGKPFIHSHIRVHGNSASFCSKDAKRHAIAWTCWTNDANVPAVPLRQKGAMCPSSTDDLVVKPNASLSVVTCIPLAFYVSSFFLKMTKVVIERSVYANGCVHLIATTLVIIFMRQSVSQTMAQIVAAAAWHQWLTVKRILL